jgi:orotidine-5'-phosphate decarboxylase
MSSPIILALDTSSVDTARTWIEATSRSIDIYKVGLEFFLKHGVEGLEALRTAGDFEIFLDLKLHDIPNTVAGAVESVVEIAPKFLTVHASGGSSMIAAAAAKSRSTSITAVTVLTSLDTQQLQSMGISSDPLTFALALGRNAVNAGATSIVCSPLEVGAMREAVGPEIKLITPGVRPSDSELGDQNRVMTPQEAVKAGADYLVIGRPITSYYDPADHVNSLAAMSIRAEEIRESIL